MSAIFDLFRESKKIRIPQPPFSTTLFPQLPPGDYGDGDIPDTWEFFWNGRNDAFRDAVLKSLKDAGHNNIIALVGDLCPSTAAYAKKLNEAGIAIFPALFNDGSDAFENSPGTWPERFRLIVDTFDKFAWGYEIGIENNEDGYHAVAGASELLRTMTAKPIGIHAKWQGGDKHGADFLLWEAPINVRNADNYSPEWIRDKAIEAADRWGRKDFFAAEINYEGRLYEAQRVALLGNGFLGVG